MILIMTSCSKNLNKSLSHEQLQQYIDAFPDYPKLEILIKMSKKELHHFHHFSKIGLLKP